MWCLLCNGVCVTITVGICTKMFLPLGGVGLTLCASHTCNVKPDACLTMNARLAELAESWEHRMDMLMKLIRVQFIRHKYWYNSALARWV